MRKKYVLSVMILFICQFILFSQENSDLSAPVSTDETLQSEFSSDTIPEQYIQTAMDTLKLVAEKYAEITDLKAMLYMKVNSDESKGTLFVKPPNRMRINFKSPKGQVISNNSKDFYIYIPKQNVALHQKKRVFSLSSAGGIITRNGLDLLIKNYLISYLDKPEYKPLENSKIKKNIEVMQLKLTWKNTAQNFRKLIMSIGKDYIIYQIDGITYNREKVQFLFTDLEINKGIPDSRFDYDPPPTALVTENFLFDAKEKEVVNEQY